MAVLYLFLIQLVRAVRGDLARSAGEAGARARASERGDQANRLIVLAAGATSLDRGGSLPLRTENVIGRAPESDIRLDDSFVSARHALLRQRGGAWYLSDLQSTNGTLLNGEAVNGERPIHYGDVIRIGDVELKLAR